MKILSVSLVLLSVLSTTNAFAFGSNDPSLYETVDHATSIVVAQATAIEVGQPNQTRFVISERLKGLDVRRVFYRTGHFELHVEYVLLLNGDDTESVRATTSSVETIRAFHAIQTRVGTAVGRQIALQKLRKSPNVTPFTKTAITTHLRRPSHLHSINTSRYFLSRASTSPDRLAALKALLSHSSRSANRFASALIARRAAGKPTSETGDIADRFVLPMFASYIKTYGTDTDITNGWRLLERLKPKLRTQLLTALVERTPGRDLSLVKTHLASLSTEEFKIVAPWLGRFGDLETDALIRVRMNSEITHNVELAMALSDRGDVPVVTWAFSNVKHPRNSVAAFKILKRSPLPSARQFATVLSRVKDRNQGQWVTR